MAEPTSELPPPDEDQRAFAEDRRARLLTLVSPPGTGKTSALAQRYASLVAEGLDPDRLLVMTFTNEARDAFVERVRATGRLPTEREVRPQDRAALEWDAPAPLWIGTIHDTCARVLRCHLQRLRFRTDVRVLDEAQRLERMARVVREANGQIVGDAEDEMAVARSLVRRMSAWKRAGVDPRDRSWRRRRARSHTGELPYLDEGAREAAARYQAVLGQENRWDFDDLLLLAHRLFEHDETIRDAWAGRFDQVLVDEFQDSEPLLVELLRTLGGNAVIAVCGDPAQRIYEWRDVVGIEALGRLRPTHGEPVERRLRRDYRLPRAVQACAEHLRARIEGDAYHAPGENEERPWPEPVHWECRDEAHLTAWLPERLRAILAAAGGGWRDQPPSTWAQIAVACRTNAQCSRWGERLAAAGIPVRIEVRGDGADLAQALLAWIEVAWEPTDEAVEVLARGAPFRLPRGALGRARRQALGYRSTLESEVRSLAAADERLAPLADALAALEPVRALSEAGSPGPALARLVRIAGLGQAAEQAPAAEREGYRETLARARRAARTAADLAEVSEQVRASGRANGDAQGHEPRVRIGTMHGLKGREIRHVVALGWSERELVRRDEEADQERRVAYTTLTRALRTFESVSCRRGGNGETQAVSRFVHEAKIEVREAEAHGGENNG